MTSETLERFKEKTAKYFVPGERNNNLIAVAGKAKFYEIDYDEALAHVRTMFGGDFTQTDEKSFKKAFDKVMADPSAVTITEFKEENSKGFIESIKEKKEREHKVCELQAEVNREVAFERKFDELREKIDKKKWVESHYKKRSKTSELMLSIFGERDIVWASRDTEVRRAELEMKTVKDWAEKNEPLSSYCFFSINPYLDKTARKKANIAKFKYMVIESDTLGRDDQLLMIIDLIEHGLPVKAVTFSGVKSYHCLVKVPDGMKDAEEYTAYTVKLFKKMNWMKNGLVDEKCANPDRLSRIPYGTRQVEDKDEYGDTILVDKEQKLIYMQDDDSLLSNDAMDVVNRWVDDICEGCDVEEDEDEKEEKTDDEIAEDELLAFVKSPKKIVDIWNDGSKNHCLMLAPHFSADGQVVYSYENMRWDSETAFYNFIKQELEETTGMKLTAKDMKEIRALNVRHKKAEKFPFVGKPMHVMKDIVNVFIPGWLGEALEDPSIPAELNEPLQKFLDNIFGDDVDAREWTLQWIREFMHTFTTMTAPVFWEIPGTGKTMLAKAFGEAIGDWIKTPPKKDDIQFNAWQEHTIIIFEESSSGSKRDGKDLGDLLKDWITETEKTIEAKGKDPVKKTIRSCFIFNANVSDSVAPVFIEDNDRRYTIIRNDNAVNLQLLWTEEDFKRWDSGELQKRLMKWIYCLPKRPDINIKKGLDSQWKHDIAEMGKNNIEWAIDQFISSYAGWVTTTEIMDEIARLYGIKATARAIGNIMSSKGYRQKTTRQHPLSSGKPKHAYFIGEDTDSDAPQPRSGLDELIDNMQ